MSKQKDVKTGLAFSGGGVRSAALCSGVLRRMLQKQVSIDYLSCVSGGGYTGASYLDWKYRNENRDDPSWHKEYFDHLRTHSNPFCNCRNPCAAILDALTLVLLVMVVSLILPWIAAFTFAIPTAFVMDFFFGRILRLPFTCPDEKTNNFTSSQIAESPNTFEELKLDNGRAECVPKFGPHMYETISLFTSILVASLLFYFLKSLFERRRTLYYIFRLLSTFSGFTLAMTLLPWFIEEYIVVTPMWVNALIIVFSIFIWLGFPPLREKASLALIVYFYAYAVKWRVYKTPILGLKYSPTVFWIMLWICGVLVWLHPFIGLLQQNAVHLYNAWRLQKSFFSPESARNPEDICADIIPWAGYCCPSKEERLNKPLTLNDIVDTQPEYKCNVTAHHWYKSEKRQGKNFELLILSPTVIERLDRDPLDEEFEGSQFIGPAQIKLSSAMATSAAVVSYDLGSREDINKPFRDLQIVLGLGLGKNLVVQPALRNVNCFVRALPLIIQFLMAVPLLALPLLHYFGGGPIWDEIGVIAFLTILCLLTLVSLLPTGAKNPGCFEKLIRWCIINVYHVRFMREVIGLSNAGPTPPPVVYLSDGGHIENLAVLPLLKLRLSRIVVVNGGAMEPGDDYATELLALLRQARDKLRCSFTGLDGRDIAEDVREKFVEVPPGQQPRSYRFLVHYYEKDGNETRKVGQGEIVLISPRHPNDGIVQFQDYEWKDFSDDHVTLELDESDWGPGPYLKASEVDRLTGCCCECCHWGLFRCLVKGLSGRFPFTPTSNQLFTPAMFSAYHREGYRACVEAEADQFLRGTTD